MRVSAQDPRLAGRPRAVDARSSACEWDDSWLRTAGRRSVRRPRDSRRPAEMVDWVREGVEMPGSSADDFQTDGVAYVYSTLRPAGPAAGLAGNDASSTTTGSKGPFLRVIAVLGVLLLPARLPVRARGRRGGDRRPGAGRRAACRPSPCKSSTVCSPAAIFVVAVLWTVVFAARRKRPPAAAGRRRQRRSRRGPLAIPARAAHGRAARRLRRPRSRRTASTAQNEGGPAMRSKPSIANCKLQNSHSHAPLWEARCFRRSASIGTAAERRSRCCPTPSRGNKGVGNFQFAIFLLAILGLDLLLCPHSARLRRRMTALARPKDPRNLRSLLRPARVAGAAAEAGAAGPQEYEELLKQAKRAPEIHAPLPACVAAADYSVTAERKGRDSRACWRSTSWKTACTPCRWTSAAWASAERRLDDRDAAIGRDAAGRLVLFVEGTASTA